jgi:putative NADH-flavin reductase
MRLALFGATGRAGGAVLRQSRAAGHEVHALARDPGKIGRDDACVTVTAGDVRTPSVVESVVRGADACVSAIGGTRTGNLAVLEQGTDGILAAMKRQGVRRLIVIQGFHLPFAGDPHNLGRPAMTAMLRLWNRRLVADTYRMAEVLRGSELDWTLIRMPRLTAGPADDGYRVGKLALGPWSSVTTGQVAHFTMTGLTTGGFVREAPMIAGAGRTRRKAPAATSGQKVPSGLAGSPPPQAAQGRP